MKRMKAEQRRKRGKRKVENKVQSARIVTFKFQALLFDFSANPPDHITLDITYVYSASDQSQLCRVRPLYGCYIIAGSIVVHNCVCPIYWIDHSSTSTLAAGIRPRSTSPEQVFSFLLTDFTHALLNISSFPVFAIEQ
jgi:hypothetical protein